jgi:hypothetical protein
MGVNNPLIISTLLWMARCFQITALGDVEFRNMEFSVQPSISTNFSIDQYLDSFPEDVKLGS